MNVEQKEYNNSSTSGKDPLLAKKEADAAYTHISTLAGKMLDQVRDQREVSLEIVDDLQEKVLAMYRQFAPSLLMECLNVVRVDKNYYRYHSVNVALLSLLVARQFNTPQEDMRLLARIGIVHDLGMMLASPRALMEVGELTEYERKMVRRHPELSVQLLEKAGETDHDLLYGIQMHHERYNGAGYPLGIAGEAISKHAQIIAIADIYDAALAKKIYRKQKSPFELLAELSKNTDGSLNPDYIKITAYNFAKMMVGRRVTLSDNSIGVVVRIDPQNLAFPIVRVVRQQFQTSPELYPVALSGYMPIFN